MHCPADFQKCVLYLALLMSGAGKVGEGWTSLSSDKLGTARLLSESELRWF